MNKCMHIAKCQICIKTFTSHLPFRNAPKRTQLGPTPLEAKPLECTSIAPGRRSRRPQPHRSPAQQKSRRERREKNEKRRRPLVSTFFQPDSAGWMARDTCFFTRLGRFWMGEMDHIWVDRE